MTMLLKPKSRRRPDKTNNASDNKGWILTGRASSRGNSDYKYLDPLSISGLSASPHASKAACMTSERLRAHATDDLMLCDMCFVLFAVCFLTL